MKWHLILLLLLVSNMTVIVIKVIIVICSPVLLIILQLLHTVIGSKSNLRARITGKAAGKQCFTGTHQQRLKLLLGKEKIIFSKVHMLMEYYFYSFLLGRIAVLRM